MGFGVQSITRLHLIKGDLLLLDNVLRGDTPQPWPNQRANPWLQPGFPILQHIDVYNPSEPKLNPQHNPYTVAINLPEPKDG
jgi:hypothetical protein